MCGLKRECRKKEVRKYVKNANHMSAIFCHEFLVRDKRKQKLYREQSPKITLLERLQSLLIWKTSSKIFFRLAILHFNGSFLRRVYNRKPGGFVLCISSRNWKSSGWVDRNGFVFNNRFHFQCKLRRNCGTEDEHGLEFWIGKDIFQSVTDGNIIAVKVTWYILYGSRDGLHTKYKPWIAVDNTTEWTNIRCSGTMYFQTVSCNFYSLMINRKVPMVVTP